MAVSILNTKITRIINQGTDLRHFTLGFEPGIQFDFKAGQFVSFLVPTTAEHKAIKRPYSIASSPHMKNAIDITWKRVDGGYVTNYLWDLKEGDSIRVQGPLGRFCLKQPIPKRIVFVSTGTGISPFRSMIHDLCEHNSDREIWNIFGNRYENEILYQEEFEALAKKHSNVRNVFTVSRPKTWKGESQYVQFMLKKYIPDTKDTHVYICGLKYMIDEVITTGHAMGFTKDQIFYEKYD